MYGDLGNLPERSVWLLEKAFQDGDYEALYNRSRVDEKEAKEMLVEFEEQYPNTLKTENIDKVLEQMKRKRDVAPE